MEFEDYNFISSNNFKGKIILTSFPGLDVNQIFQKNFFLKQLQLFKSNNCSSISSFVEDKEFDKLCIKKKFVESIYKNNLKWYHLPISDFSAPSSDFKYKWETTKILLKNELTEGHNIIFHCRGGRGRAGTAAAMLLIEFGEDKNKAINIVRAKRKGAIESKAQEEFVLNYRSLA